MCDALSKGENVKISGFGTFILRDKGQRVGRNPKTGVEVPIAPRRVLTFRASQMMRDRIVGGLTAGDGAGRQGGRRVPDDRRTVATNSACRSTSCAIGKRDFPQLRPLQRAGNRRYYRPDDVALVRRIHRLLNEEGYTVRGVQKLLRDKGVRTPQRFRCRTPSPDRLPARRSSNEPASGVDLSRLIELRDRLASALDI